MGEENTVTSEEKVWDVQIGENVFVLVPAKICYVDCGVLVFEDDENSMIAAFPQGQWFGVKLNTLSLEVLNG